MPKDWIVLHNIGQKHIAETSDKLFWDFHVISKTSQEKVATYLKELKHCSALLHKDPRTPCGSQAQSVMGLFINYVANKALQNQEKKAVNMSLEFTPAHEKSFNEFICRGCFARNEMQRSGVKFCPPLCSRDQVLARQLEQLLTGLCPIRPTVGVPCWQCWHPRNPSISACRSIV